MSSPPAVNVWNSSPFRLSRVFSESNVALYLGRSQVDTNLNSRILTAPWAGVMTDDAVRRMATLAGHLHARNPTVSPVVAHVCKVPTPGHLSLTRFSVFGVTRQQRRCWTSEAPPQVPLGSRSALWVRVSTPRLRRADV